MSQEPPRYQFGGPLFPGEVQAVAGRRLGLNAQQLRRWKPEELLGRFCSTEPKRFVFEFEVNRLRGYAWDQEEDLR